MGQFLAWWQACWELTSILFNCQTRQVFQINGHNTMLKLGKTSRHWRFQRISPVKLDFIRSLCQGAFVEVMLAEYREMCVAVKLIHHRPTRPVVGSDAGRMFKQEVDFMRQMRYQEMVLFLG